MLSGKAREVRGLRWTWGCSTWRGLVQDGAGVSSPVGYVLPWGLWLHGVGWLSGPGWSGERGLKTLGARVGSTLPSVSRLSGVVWSMAPTCGHHCPVDTSGSQLLSMLLATASACQGFSPMPPGALRLLAKVPRSLMSLGGLGQASRPLPLKSEAGDRGLCSSGFGQPGDGMS